MSQDRAEGRTRTQSASGNELRARPRKGGKGAPEGERAPLLLPFPGVPQRRRSGRHLGRTAHLLRTPGRTPRGRTFLRDGIEPSWPTLHARNGPMYPMRSREGPAPDLVCRRALRSPLSSTTRSFDPARPRQEPGGPGPTLRSWQPSTGPPQVAVEPGASLAHDQTHALRASIAALPVY